MAAPIPKPRTILSLEADRLITGARQQAYSDASENFKHIADGFEAVTGIHMEPYQVGVFMAITKLARTRQSPTKADHWVDLLGYGALAGELALGTANTKQSVVTELRAISMRALTHLHTLSRTLFAGEKTAPVSPVMPDGYNDPRVLTGEMDVTDAQLEIKSKIEAATQTEPEPERNAELTLSDSQLRQIKALVAKYDAQGSGDAIG